MKPRRVILSIEVETSLPIATLRNVEFVQVCGRDRIMRYIIDDNDNDNNDPQDGTIQQVQVNVVRPRKETP